MKSFAIHRPTLFIAWALLFSALAAPGCTQQTITRTLADTGPGQYLRTQAFSQTTDPSKNTGRDLYLLNSHPSRTIQAEIEVAFPGRTVGPEPITKTVNIQPGARTKLVREPAGQAARITLLSARFIN